MNTKYLLSAAVILGLWSFGAVFAQEVDAVARGRKPLEPATAPAYRQTWALIIGIDYKGRQDDLRDSAADQAALPKLNNAVKDATVFAKTLQQYYGTESGYQDDEHVRVVTEEKATFQRIKEELGKLCDPQRVAPEDSVLIFFSGHGVRTDKAAARLGDAVAILPYDVMLSAGKPIGNTIGIPYELVKDLDKSPARHKLLILDCCYSGEIFDLPVLPGSDSVAFRARSETDDRSDKNLLYEPAFQALASCRASQVASDGSDGHSPFAAALIDGLKRLPSRNTEDRRVWVNRLFSHIWPQFDQTQRPDCRNLIGTQGEFCFFPAPDKLKDLDEFRISVSEQSLLKASVASRQGNWWFDEMPWFIPSIREDIIKKHEERTKTRASTYGALVDPRELEATTREVLRALPKQELRYAHARLLLNTCNTKDFKKTLETIRNDLTEAAEGHETTSRGGPSEPTSRKPKPDLAAWDLHLLAVTLHALGDKEEAQVAYLAAAGQYEESKQEDDRPLLSILEALCCADHGELLFSQLSEAEQAANKFQEAQRSIQSLAGGADALSPGSRNDAASVFRIYTLCREANAWLQVNHWKKANDCLLTALHLARDVAPDHYLAAHVYHSRAWAHIHQWEIQQAECSFRRSNDILAALFQKELGLQETPPTAEAIAAASKTKDQATELAISPAGACPSGTLPFPETFGRSADFRSKVAYLHNLHGIAMATRFQGYDALAAARYRAIADRVEETVAQFHETTVDNAIEVQLLTRVINTGERLADCNLFGSPEQRDLKEAVDDYRRALSRVHQLRGIAGDRTRAQLLYKLALALSLPSPVQDIALAQEASQRADTLYAEQQRTATGQMLALGELTTKAIAVIQDQASGSNGGPVGDNQSTAKLRTAIHAFRDRIGQVPHRDQLEVSLFAARLLLEFGNEPSRFQRLQDADLLLSFCRMAMTSYHGNGVRNVDSGLEPESRAYLRPYYDAIMRAKMAATPKHVKDLLEVQWEATQGSLYVKNEEAAPVLATYVLDGECCLLFDLPRGESKCVSLAKSYDVDTIRRACRPSEAELALPRDVETSLRQWIADAKLNGLRTVPHLLWKDPVRRVGDLATESTVVVETSFSGKQSQQVRQLSAASRFPFRLPADMSLRFQEAGIVPRQP